MPPYLFKQPSKKVYKLVGLTAIVLGYFGQISREAQDTAYKGPLEEEVEEDQDVIPGIDDRGKDMDLPENSVEEVVPKTNEEDPSCAVRDSSSSTTEDAAPSATKDVPPGANEDSSDTTEDASPCAIDETPPVIDRPPEASDEEPKCITEDSPKNTTSDRPIITEEDKTKHSKPETINCLENTPDEERELQPQEQDQSSKSVTYENRKQNAVLVPNTTSKNAKNDDVPVIKTVTTETPERKTVPTTPRATYENQKKNAMLVPNTTSKIKQKDAAPATKTATIETPERKTVPTTPRRSNLPHLPCTKDCIPPKKINPIMQNSETSENSVEQQDLISNDSETKNIETMQNEIQDTTHNSDQTENSDLKPCASEEINQPRKEWNLLTGLDDSGIDLSEVYEEEDRAKKKSKYSKKF